MNKKELVINTARNLFTKYGYKKVTMDEIAKESGVTKKTIYTYFKDKDSMFQYFILEEIEIMKKEIEKERKKNINFLEFVSSNVYKMLIYRKNSNLISSITENKSYINFYDKEIIKYIENIIKEEINKKHIKDCDTHLTAFIIYKIYISVVFEYDKTIDEKKVTEEITSILKDGLLN